jgi:hypothetical protein
LPVEEVRRRATAFVADLRGEALDVAGEEQQSPRLVHLWNMQRKLTIIK